MSLKNTHKLPGQKDKVRNVTRFPVNGNEIVNSYAQKDIRPLFTKASFPVFLDFSEGCFQLESDDFLKACANVVKELNLSSNLLIEMNSIGHLNKLKKLVVNKNNLVEISVQGLSSLVFLGLCNNRLDHFPDLTDCSKKLLNIDISYNRLVDGFDQLAKLKMLKVLDLSNNGISMTLGDFNKKILENLKKIKTLEYISLENNPIEKSVEEFRIYISIELPKLKYYNWVIISKEERTKGSKLESESFWVKIQQQQQMQQQQHQQQTNSIPIQHGSISKMSSSPNLQGSGSIPLKPGSGSGTGSFVQRKPSVGISNSLKFSPLARSSDNFFSPPTSSSPPTTTTNTLSSSSNDFKNPLASSSNSIGSGSPMPSSPLVNSNNKSDPITIGTHHNNNQSDFVDVTSSPKSVPLKGRRLSITGSGDSVFTKLDSPSKNEINVSSGGTVQKQKMNIMSDLHESFGGSRKSSLSTLSNSPKDLAPLSSSPTNPLPAATKDLSREECESCLDQLLEELPSVDNQLDFSTYKSYFEQKIFLDLLYRAITEEAIPDELFEMKVEVPKLQISEEKLVSLVDDEELIKPTEEIVTTTSATVSITTPTIVDNKATSEPIAIKTTPSTPTKTTRVWTKVKEPDTNKPVDQIPVIKPTSPDIEVIKDVKPVIETPVAVAKPIAKPIAKPVVKPVAKPVAKPVPTIPEDVKPLPPVTITPEPIVVDIKSVESEKLVEEVKPILVVKTPLAVSKPTATVPITKAKSDLDSIEFDVNQFNFEIEQTLADIESTYGFGTSTEVKPVEPKQEPVVKKPEPETKPVVINKPTITTTPIVAKQPPKTIGIPQAILSDITKLQDDSIKTVENATNKLDSLLESYKTTTTSSDDDVLDKLITKFENDNKPVGNNNNGSNINIKPPTIASISSSTNTSSSNLKNTPSSNIHTLIQWVIQNFEIKIETKLGMGSFGDCFTAKINSNRTVILKKIRTQRFSDQFLNPFKDEISRLRDIQNENLSPVIGCCLDTNIYICSPYYEGNSLQQLLDKPDFQVTNEFIHRVSSQVSKAMVALHSKDVTHRSLKPNNIIIESSSGNAYVRDFAFNGMKDSIYRTGNIGSPYMAPELFNSSCNSYDQNCDQFSFSMILLQLFTRQQPYQGVQPTRLGDTIVNGVRPDIPDSVPSVFNRLIRACWNPDPSARPSFLTISKILTQPFQRIFTGTPTASTLNLASNIGANNNNNSTSTNNTNQVTLTVQNNSTLNSKHQFSETGDLKRKMSLVLDKIMQMFLDTNLDVIRKALKALENLSSPENHSLMIGIGLLNHLVRLLSNVELQDQLLKLLYALCTNESLSNEFIYSNGFVPLAKLIQHHTGTSTANNNSSTLLQAIKLLTILADEQHLEQIRISGILAILLKHLHSTNELLVMQVVGALSRILLDFNNQIYFIESGSVSILLEMLNSSHTALSMRSLLALCCLITNDRCKEELLHAGIIPKLMELLASPQKLLRLHTLKIIQTISKDNKFRDILVRENCIKLLSDQLVNSSDESLPVILSCLSSILKDQISMNIFYASLGIDKISLVISQSQTKISSFHVYGQQLKQQQQIQSTIEVLSGGLSVLYAIINHENSRNRIKPIIPRLVDILQKSEQVNTDILVQVLQCLTSFVNHVSCIDAIEQTMCIPIIISLLRNNNHFETRLHSLKFISTLVKMNPKFTQTILSSGVLQVFIDFLQDKSNIIKEESIATISWLTSSPECRAVFLQKGVLKFIITYISISRLVELNIECIERLLWALSFFALDEPAQAIMRESNVFDFVIKSLDRPEEVFKTLAIKTVLILSQKPQNREPLKRFSAVEFLKPLEFSTNKSLQLASKKIISLLNTK